MDPSPNVASYVYEEAVPRSSGEGARRAPDGLAIAAVAIQGRKGTSGTLMDEADIFKQNFYFRTLFHHRDIANHRPMPKILGNFFHKSLSLRFE
jgi:hypothetical protein